MSINTTYYNWVSDWSNETCPEIIAFRKRSEDIYAAWQALPEAERETSPLVSEIKSLGWHPPHDPRLLYYDRRHMAGVSDEHWDEFAAWCVPKGYKPFKGMPMFHSMTMLSCDRL